MRTGTPGLGRRAGRGEPATIVARAGAAFAVVAASTLALAPSASADDQGEEWAVTRYDLVADVAESGTIDVTLELDFDFGDEEGHGPYIVVGVLQEIADDPDHYRRFTVTDPAASSPSGAPADVRTETDDGVLGIFVGDEDQTVDGVQTYVITYTIDGIVNPAEVTGGPDAIYWNLISRWEVPLADVSITVNAPGTPDAVACYAGGVGSDAPCDGTAISGTSTTFTQAEIPAESGLTVALDWPAGTLDAPPPDLVPRRTWGNAFAVTPATAGVGLGIAALGTALVGVRAGRRGRDEVYSDVTPGLAPASGAGSVTRRRGKTPVAVRFTPPDGVRPGEMGTLADEVANPHDVTATIIDLAVRGYLRIDEVAHDGKGKPTDWELVKLDRRNPDLVDYEQSLYDAIFDGRDGVRLSDLKTTFAESMAATQKALYEEVVARGWFSRNPASVRAAWYGLGAILVVAGLAGTAVLAGVAGWGIAGLGVLVVGIVALSLAHAMPARTAAGSAVLEQTRGFELYLTTAEANQLRFSEGEDVFSRYLPYAIAFGVAERWAKVFSDAAAAGRALPEPTWYVGAGHAYGVAGYGIWSSGGLTDSLQAFSSAATAAITAPAPGSSGSSGTSGGFSGGGVSGGGGGGW